MSLEIVKKHGTHVFLLKTQAFDKQTCVWTLQHSLYTTKASNYNPPMLTLKSMFNFRFNHMVYLFHNKRTAI